MGFPLQQRGWAVQDAGAFCTGGLGASMMPATSSTTATPASVVGCAAWGAPWGAPLPAQMSQQRQPGRHVPLAAAPAAGVQTATGPYPGAAMQDADAYEPLASTGGEEVFTGTTVRMTNFPASWTVPSAEATLPTKISNLLLKFGDLESAPVISKPDGKVSAMATFVSEAAAQQAVQTLHDVDNRTESEKRNSGGAPPKPSERFCVQVLGVAAQQRPQTRIRICEVPEEWTAKDIHELCKEYGPVESASDDGPGCFLVVFEAEKTAQSAQKALHGLELQNDVGYSALICELLQAEEPDTPEEGPPFIIFVDELLPTTKAREPGPEDREIFLWDIPLQDYNEQQLHEWLEGFGEVEKLFFLRDMDEGLNEMEGGTAALKQPLQPRGLTGKGYVRFQSPDEAGSLIDSIAAFPEEDAEGNVQGNWSLSERLERLLLPASGDSSGGEADLAAGRLLLKSQLETVTEACRCSLVVLAGSGQCCPGPDRPSGLVACDLAKHPLHFAAWPRRALVKNSHRLKEQLVKILRDMPKLFPHGGSFAADSIAATRLVQEEATQEVQQEEEPAWHYVFIDELPMPRRPQVTPTSHDREVYLTSLPVKGCTGEQVESWSRGFGEVEDFHLLREQTQEGAYSGRGYVRFGTHAEAAGCVEAQMQTASTEEGDVIAVWSESERAGRRASSVYGMDLQNAFVGPSGRIMASILVSAKMKAPHLWLLSELRPAKDPAAPQPQGKQLQFAAFCREEHFESLKTVLASVLQSFHDNVTAHVLPQREPAGQSQERSRQQDPPVARRSEHTDSGGETRGGRTSHRGRGDLQDGSTKNQDTPRGGRRSRSRDRRVVASWRPTPPSVLSNLPPVARSILRPKAQGAPPLRSS